MEPFGGGRVDGGQPLVGLLQLLLLRLLLLLLLLRGSGLRRMRLLAAAVLWLAAVLGVRRWRLRAAL